MSSSLIVALEFFGVVGVLICLAARELYSLRRDKKRDDDR